MIRAALPRCPASSKRRVMNGTARAGRRVAVIATAGAAALGLALVPALSASAQSRDSAKLHVPPGAIRHVIVIDLENESYSATFGPSSPATYEPAAGGAVRGLQAEGTLARQLADLLDRLAPVGADPALRQAVPAASTAFL